MSDGQISEQVSPEKLPAEVRANMLSNEESIFFNVAKFEHAQRLAKVFADSTMVPEQFRGKPGNCLIALNYAYRIQADPFMVLQTMHVIHGKPGIEGKLVAALINQSGKYKKPLTYQWLDENDKPMERSRVVADSKRDNRGCQARAVDKVSGEPIHGPKISWEIVYGEGWFGKAGSKWKTMPELMFMYRAASWFANIHCPEVKLGMPTTEELRDIVELQKTPNGSYASDLADKIKNGAPGAAEELYSGKTSTADTQEPPPEDRVTDPSDMQEPPPETEEAGKQGVDPQAQADLKAAMKKQADTMIHGIAPATAQTFTVVTGDGDAGVFWRMRKKGLGEFFDMFENVMGGWPQEIQDFIRAKCKNIAGEHPEFIDRLNKALANKSNLPEGEITGSPNGYTFCPDGGPYAGKQVSFAAACSVCDQKCDEYALYLDAQRGGTGEETLE